MRYRFKKIYSSLLILIMTMGTFQGAMAIDFSHIEQGKECQVMQISLSDANGMEVDGNCPTQPDENNHIGAECTMPCSSLQATQAPPLAPRAESEEKILSGSDPILSHHTDILKRPPKA